MPSLQALPFPDAEYSAVPLGGVLGIFSGKSLNYKYLPESKTIRRFGLVNPESDLSLADGGAGTLAAGSYVVTFVEVDSQANQGNGLRSGPPRGSSGQSFTLAAAGAITVTLPNGMTNSDADERWIYVTTADGVWPTLGRVAAVSSTTLTYTIDGSVDPDFANYPLDQNRGTPPNKAYPMKMNRRLLMWGAEELRTTLQFTVGSTEAFYVSGDQLDEGAIGMVAYPDDEPRGYVIDNWNSGSPYSVTLDTAFVGTSASETTSNISTKLCRPSGELSWSEPADYENFPAANVRYVELSGSDPETGCAVVNGRGLLFTVQKTFQLSFDQTPALGWGSVFELSTQIGCLAHRTVQDIGGTLFWLAEGGIAASMGGAPRIISDEIGPEFEDLVREATGRMRSAFAINWAAKQRYLCFVPQAGDSVGCSKCIVCEYGSLPGEPRFRFSIYEFTKEFTCASIERHTVVSGTSTTYEEFPILGDKDGFVWSFGIGDADGPDSGTVSGTVGSAASSPEFMTDPDASFDTTGLGLQGMVVTVRRASDGTEQEKLIGGNTADTLYPDQEWDWVPVSGDTYRIGAIDAYYETGESALGGDQGIKRGSKLISTYDQESSGTLDLEVFYDFSSTPASLSNEGSTLDLSASGGRGVKRLSRNRAHYMKIRWRNRNPNEPFTLKAATLDFDGPDETR